jgi:hypothetical protein
LQIARQRASFERAPPTDPGVQLCVDAWYALDTTREAWGDALSPIPWDSVKDWGIDQGLDHETRELVHAALRIADGVRSKRAEADRTMKRAAAEAKAKGAGR